jgi:hypothetical protein
MGFDTALLRLVGTGLVAVGNAAGNASGTGTSAPQPEEIINQLARRGEGPRAIALIERVAHDISIFYRAHPERVLQHVTGLPDIVRAEPPAAADLAAATEANGATPGAASPARRLALDIVQRATASGQARNLGLEEGLSVTLLEALLARVIPCRDMLSVLPGFAAPSPAPEAKPPEQPVGEAAPTAVPASKPAPATEPQRGQLPDAVLAIVKEIGTRESVALPALTGIAQALLQSNAPSADFANRLAAKASDYREIEARLTRIGGGGDAAVGTLRAQAAHAVHAARYDLADRLLGQAEEIDLGAVREQVPNLDERKASAAETRAERGQIEELRCNYRAAAGHYAAAATCLPEADLPGRWRQVLHQAEALARQEAEQGDKSALDEALNLHAYCLSLSPRERASKDWAFTQNFFGGLLCRQGVRDNDIERLQMAAKLSRQAADELTGRREPLGWASAVTSFADTLMRIAERNNDPATYQAAVAAYRETLAVYTRDTTPIDWATVQARIAEVLSNQPGGVANPIRWREAIAAYRLALGVLTGERYIDARAKAQLGLARTSGLLAQHEGNPRLLADAETQLRAALESLPPESGSAAERASGWQCLGDVLLAAGRKATSSVMLARSIEAYRNALQCADAGTPKAVRAASHRGLAIAIEGTVALGADASALSSAIESYRTALELIQRDSEPRLWALTELDLARALFAQGSETNGLKTIAEALVAEQAAIETLTGLGENELANAVRDGLAEKIAIYERLKGAAVATA